MAINCDNPVKLNLELIESRLKEIENESSFIKANANLPSKDIEGKLGP